MKKQGKLRLVPRVVYDAVVVELKPEVNPGARVGDVLVKGLREDQIARWKENNLLLWDEIEGP